MDELDDLDNELIKIIRRESGLLNPVKSTEINAFLRQILS